jgi:hypothetical protein
MLFPDILCVSKTESHVLYKIEFYKYGYEVLQKDEVVQ